MRQKSRATWINLRDCNTKYFHAYMRARQARNKVNCIYNEQQIKVSEPKQLQKEFTQFFQQLLGTAVDELLGIDINIVRNGPCLTMTQQQQLLQPVTPEEISQIMQSLPSDKAPGIDRYPAEFFRQFRPIIGGEVTEANPTYVKEFRPIACCSTLYKIIAKVLITRLKLVVDLLVGPIQTAFIEGRNILDNVIMAHELIKGYTQKAVSPRCMIKIRSKEGVKAGRPNVSILVCYKFYTSAFADDILMCCRADEVSMKLMMEAFEHFSVVSGLKANLEKSSLYIAGVPMEFKDKMLTELHLTLGTLPFKYLGVPLSTRKLTIHQCMPLVEKIVDRIRSWTSKFLSYAGRLQLIKSVLFEMQTYWAQVFLIPKKVIKLVNNICRSYLWTGVHDNAHRAPVAWETLRKPRATGGLNIINYEIWNKTALTKLLWAIMAKKDK
ncbi:PREDICTED: uncharacterized protein LOC109231731 [Nicotiana attenuata]|uniref:uncharacterized protein LOC109231731 n=1 Tax=Nicotiana attenuata TaxID=49451 RepID=UPI00090573D0|nr:PREDICTED: uncharacterized protein LOC109231731 [Nicotiana attenuata]